MSKKEKNLVEDKNSNEIQFLNKIDQINGCYIYLKELKGRDTDNASQLINASHDLHLNTVKEFNTNQSADRVWSALSENMLALHIVDMDVYKDPDKDIGFFSRAIVDSNQFRPYRNLEGAKDEDLKKQNPINRNRVYRSDIKKVESRTVQQVRGAKKKDSLLKIYMCYPCYKASKYPNLQYSIFCRFDV